MTDSEGMPLPNDGTVSPKSDGTPHPKSDTPSTGMPADRSAALLATCHPFRPAFSPRSCYFLRDADEEAAFTSSGGAPEATLITWATSLIEPGQTFIDVGAHVGTWAQHFATKCRTVHAFEPQLSTYARLREGVKIAELGAVVTCHAVALGARGKVDLHVVSGDGGGSTLRHRPELPPEIGVERVRAGQLDDYTFEDVGLIKIDVEGYEIDVLRGAVKTLAEHHPRLLLEAWTHDWYARDRVELIAYVESLGYRVQPIADRPEMLYAERFPVRYHKPQEALRRGRDRAARGRGLVRSGEGDGAGHDGRWASAAGGRRARCVDGRICNPDGDRTAPLGLRQAHRDRRVGS